MDIIKDKEFGGERPLFESHNLRLENVIIREGESAIKECSNIEAFNCRFEGNYPFWHVHGFSIEKCFFDVGGRSALWYSDHLKMKDTVIDAPKMFREMTDLELENVTLNDADEVFWRCKNIKIKNLVLHGGTGIPADMIKKAISLGVAKINVNTECQLSFQEATRKYIEAGKDLEGKGFDPRKLLAPGAEAIKATVKEKMELFGSVGKAE